MLINVPLLLNVTNQFLYKSNLELCSHLSEGTPMRLCCQSERLKLFEQMKSDIEKEFRWCQDPGVTFDTRVHVHITVRGCLNGYISPPFPENTLFPLFS